MTSLPNYSEPDSPTQKRGKGIARNPMSDTWTEGAYIKPHATADKIVDVERMQDRWQCGNCGHFNDRGVSKSVHSKVQGGASGKQKKAQASKSKASARKARRGSETPATVAGPSNATVLPVEIPGPGPTGVGPDDHVVCVYCGQEIFPELIKEDP